MRRDVSGPNVEFGIFIFLVFMLVSWIAAMHHDGIGFAFLLGAMIVGKDLIEHFERKSMKRRLRRKR